jgi:hypothetical protein
MRARMAGKLKLIVVLKTLDASVLAREFPLAG